MIQRLTLAGIALGFVVLAGGLAYHAATTGSSGAAFGALIAGFGALTCVGAIEP